MFAGLYNLLVRPFRHGNADRRTDEEVFAGLMMQHFLIELMIRCWVPKGSTIHPVVKEVRRLVDPEGKYAAIEAYEATTNPDATVAKKMYARLAEERQSANPTYAQRMVELFGSSAFQLLLVEAEGKGRLDATGIRRLLDHLDHAVKTEELPPSIRNSFTCAIIVMRIQLNFSDPSAEELLAKRQRELIEEYDREGSPHL